MSNPAGRFAGRVVEPTSDSVASPIEGLGFDPVDVPADSVPLETVLRPEATRRIITRNSSPDIPFEQSLNPYKGCEHGCIYCFARRTHSYLDLSPGQDFETQIFYKPNAVALLRAELAKPSYEVSPIALGMNTDAYQPAEKKLRLTRELLELLLELRHPVSLITKSTLILRDIDLLAEFATHRLVHVGVSLTTLSNELKRRLEPRTAGPAQRLSIVRELSAAGVPVSVLLAPIIPALNDHEIEDMLAAAAEAGALHAGYVLLRLPDEVRPLFVEWLETHYPDRAQHVLSLLKQMRGGRLNDPRFHDRQRGHGPFAELIRNRFRKASARVGLDQDRSPPLDCDQFRGPGRQDQLSLL